MSHHSDELVIKCDNCGREVPADPHARKTQRFCSEHCRNRWHGERRKAAMKLLAQTEAQS